jgi:hypothetical protein
MEALLREAVYQGSVVDLVFTGKQPMFGDLFLICGTPHPEFPPSQALPFDKLSELGFTQVDDYFGIENGEGDVIVWLAPLVDGEEVYHHAGPFTGLRLRYSVLRNLPASKALFLKAIRLFTQYLEVDVVYKLRNLNLGSSPELAIVENDIDQIVNFWKEKNIETGSENALKVPD